MALSTEARGGVPDGAGGGTDPLALAAQVAVAFASEPEASDSTQRLLELVVEAFSDWGTVHLLQPDGSFNRVAAHHRDPSRQAAVRQLRAAPSVDPASAEVMTEPLATRRAIVLQPTVEELRSMAPTEQVLALWLDLGLAAGVLLPLVASDRPVGILGLMSCDRDAFTPARVAALESLAAECALLAETARLTRQAESERGERLRVRAVLDSLLAHAPVATAIIDLDGRVLHHNEALAAMSGSTAPVAAEPPSGPIAHLSTLVPEVAGHVEPLIRRVQATGTAADPFDLRTGTAPEHRWWQVNAFPIRRADDVLFGVGLMFVETTQETLASLRRQESLARLDLSLKVGGLGTWDWDLLTNRVAWSAAMSEIAGLPPDQLEGSGGFMLSALPEDDREGVRRKLEDAALSGADYHDVFPMVRPSGEVRWVEARGLVVEHRDGRPARMIGVASDVTERRANDDVKLKLLEREHQARLAAESSREHLQLLAEVSGALALHLDPLAVHASLASLLVPRIADWCVIDALDEEGDVQQMAVVHLDRRQADLVAELSRRALEPGGDGLWSVGRALRTGRSERVNDITDVDLERFAVDDEHLDVLRALTPRAAMVAPMVARGRVLGVLTVVSAGSRTYSDDDRALLESIASRAATAIDTALLFASRTQVTRALQETLKPPELPEIPGIDLGVRYQVADLGIEIGGDFYDVFEVPTGWEVLLGDVCGKGPAAAAVTGVFRHTLRAVAPGLAEAGHGPATVLGATNDAILDQIDDSRFATAALVELVPERGRARARVACGGHPRPMLVRASGEVERIDATGTLLGVLPDPPLQEVELELDAGDALVLYTDGVTEARNGSLQFGESRLMEALAGAQHLATALDVADRVVHAVDVFRDPGSPADDVAVVVVRVPSLHDDPPVEGGAEVPAADDLDLAEGP